MPLTLALDSPRQARLLDLPVKLESSMAAPVSGHILFRAMIPYFGAKASDAKNSAAWMRTMQPPVEASRW